MSVVWKTAKVLGLEQLPQEAALSMIEWFAACLAEQKADRKEFQRDLEHMSAQDLKVYVPDVYQKNIYDIDYDALKEQGIRLISFDIDDTIGDVAIHNLQADLPFLEMNMPSRAKELFHRLKDMGFTVVLLTNAKPEIGRGACESLQADGYLARAGKPGTQGFEELARQYGVTPAQMAHVGNNIREDIGGGNRFGATTCLVRRAGMSMQVAKVFAKCFQVPTKGHVVRKRLLKHDLWRKHHKYEHGDQYYQLGEEPAYQKKFSQFKDGKHMGMGA
jgi:predicted HAD superfamily phosphohydrolase YqeG